MQGFTLRQCSVAITEPYLVLAILGFMLATSLLCKEWWSFFSSKEQGPHLSYARSLIHTNNRMNLQAALFEKPFFGVYVPTNSNSALIKQSLLDFVVVGILLAEKGEESQAILRQANGEEKMYFINDKLPGGAVIKHISAREVVIFYKGELERLLLPSEKLTFGGLPKSIIKDSK